MFRCGSASPSLAARTLSPRWRPSRPRWVARFVTAARVLAFLYVYMTFVCLVYQGLLGPAGVAASVQNTGQQWDYPNAWPPLQDIIIEAFANTGGMPFCCCRTRSLRSATTCPLSTLSIASTPVPHAHMQVPKGRLWLRTLRIASCARCTPRGAATLRSVARWSRSGMRQPLAALAAEESIECRQARPMCAGACSSVPCACRVQHSCRSCAGFGWSNGVMLSLLSRYGWKGDGSSPEAI